MNLCQTCGDAYRSRRTCYAQLMFVVYRVLTFLMYSIRKTGLKAVTLLVFSGEFGAVK